MDAVPLIIDKTTAPPPKWVYQPPPVFKTTLEAEQYFHREFERWVYGHAGLTGMHYFYLQQVHLKDMDGNIIRPIWRDVDEIIFNEIELCLQNQEDLLVYKRREVGATSIFMGGIPFWYARVYPGSTCNLTSKDKDAFARAFKDKISITYEHFDRRVLNPDPVKYNESTQHYYLQLGLKAIEPTGELSYRKSDFNLQETSEKPKSVVKFSGGRARYTYIDEAPLHTRRTELLESIDATRRKGAERKGFLAMAGTIEPKLTNEELAEFQNFIEESEHLNMRTLFIPGWMGLEQFSVNGWSNKEQGMAWLEENYARLDQMEDKRHRIAFQKQYPRYESDIFELSRGGEFEDDVTEILKDHLKYLQSQKIKHDTRYTFVNRKDIVIAKPDKEGKFIMVENVKPNIKYWMVIDGTATSKKTGNEKGSSMAVTIMKGFDPEGHSYTPVCMYLERPEVMERSYMYTVDMFKYFNTYGGMVEIAPEANAGVADSYTTFLGKQGLLAYCMKRKDLTGNNRSQKGKYGQYVTDDVREYQMIKSNPFLRKYARNIKSIFFIEQLLIPKGVNADIRDSFYMFMIANTSWDKDLKKATKLAYEVRHTLVRNNAGEFVWKSTRVPIGSQADKRETNNEYNDMVLALKNKYGSKYKTMLKPEEAETLSHLKDGLTRNYNF